MVIGGNCFDQSGDITKFGRVLVFSRDEEEWTAEFSWYPDSSVSSDHTGANFSMDESFVLVGQKRKERQPGGAYLFVRNENGWEIEEWLEAGAGTGSCLALSSGTAVIGGSSESFLVITFREHDEPEGDDRPSEWERAPTIDLEKEDPEIQRLGSALDIEGDNMIAASRKVARIFSKQNGDGVLVS